MDTLEITSPADFHTHLRQGDLMHLVTPHVRKGGFDLAYVMPNLSPPITTVDQALDYKKQLVAIDPHVDYLMTLFLTPSLTPSEIQKAKKAGIAGVKSYPRGVTTGSDAGVESYERYYPVFEEMERCDMVLNLHGEVPSSAIDGTTVLNAEPRFLKHLVSLHEKFPKLRIVLEHATTKEAVETVKRLGDTVACSITVHHLFLVVDDWAGQPLHFCKPVAKTYEDRKALREVILSGHPRFFLGSDSAPHPFHAKMPSLPLDTTSTTPKLEEKAVCACAAGVYTSPNLLPLVAHAFESVAPEIPLDRLENFVSTFGRAFYKVPAGINAHKVKLQRTTDKVESGHALVTAQEQSTTWVVPFKANQCIGWTVL